MRVIDCLNDRTVAYGIDPRDAAEMVERLGGKKNGYIIEEDVDEIEKLTQKPIDLFS